MKRLPRISDAEWLVMQVLWPSPGRTADEVVAALRGNPAAPGWSERTIRTLINRLLHKQALTYEREGRKYRYFPAVSQRQCVKQARRSFVDRVYGGTAKPMLAAFIEDADLSPEDIEELKRMLDEKGTTE
jgi:BlaI family penicillinase repressor